MNTSLIFGSPQQIVGDRGTSKDFKKYSADNKINHVLNAVRITCVNSQVERLNCSILSMLRPITILQDDREEDAVDLNQLRQEAVQRIHDERYSDIS